MKNFRINLWVLFPLFILIIGFILRSRGLLNNYPFWVDEFGSAKQAKLILEKGFETISNRELYFESNHVASNVLVALFFSIFGQKEWVARLPFIIIGSFVPVLLYFLTKKIFDRSAAISASLLAVFSYFMITWSRQARGYVLQEALILGSLLIYLQILSHKKERPYLVLLLVIFFILGALTHVMFYIFIFSTILHFLMYQKKNVVSFLRKTSVLIGLPVFVLIIVFIFWKQGIFAYFKSSFFGANNLWYYHSFLWREYGLITLLGFSGLIIGYLKKSKYSLILIIHFLLQVLFLSFLFGHYLSKYLLPVFPYLFIGMGYFISYLINNVLNNKSERFELITIVLITLFIIANGNKFIYKPRAYYSINHDFREIANINYHEIYGIIIKKGLLSEKQTAIIETWPDRAYWYVGNNYPNVYYYRWENEPGIASGHAKKTSFFYTKDGEKAVNNRLRFIGGLSDLKKVVQKYPRGFIFIDDSTLPHDVIEYAEKYLKKELYLDHFPLDDNPYSIWPATLYSWGIE